ncbi:MAG: oligosaccharide flippase family protein [Cyclobacteriaceae bacterium]
MADLAGSLRKINYRHWLKVLGRFFTFQVGLKAIGMLITFGVIRLLSKEDYAYFTMATAMVGAITVLADSGVGSGVSAIGGQIWQDKKQMGVLLNTALAIRKQLFSWAALAVAPVLFWLLHKQGTPLMLNLGIIALVIGIAYLQIETGIYKNMLKLRACFDDIQKLELVNSLVRGALFLALGLLFFNTLVAIGITLLGFAAEMLFSKKIAGQQIQISSENNPDYRKRMLGIVGRQFPNTLYFALKGQLTVFIISFFGNVESIAEIGALSKFGLFMSLITVTFQSVIVPEFAKTHDTKDMMRRFLFVLGGMSIIGLVFGGTAYFFPRFFLAILGDHYNHLEQELILIIISILLQNIRHSIFSLNVAKGWIPDWPINVSLNVVSIVICSYLFDLSSTMGVIKFNLYISLPALGYYIIHSVWHIKSK